MFCERCGKEIREGVAFCVQCGAPVRPESEDEQKEKAGKSAGFSRSRRFKMSLSRRKLPSRYWRT